MSEVIVSVDDRARLVTAVLAAGKWPEQEQGQLTHAVHPHAKQTRTFVAPFREHTAVATVNRLLAEDVPLRDLFAAALRSQWPTLEPSEPLPDSFDAARWLEELSTFRQMSHIGSEFWALHKDAWQKAVDDLTEIFAGGALLPFMEKLTGGPLTRGVVVMPNIVYPALTCVAVETADRFYLLLPPPKAVGESPPWPFEEDPGWVHARVCERLTELLLADALAAGSEKQQALFKHAVIALCLESALDEFEAQAYVLRSKKQRDLPELPGAVETVRSRLGEGGGEWTAVVTEL